MTRRRSHHAASSAPLTSEDIGIAVEAAHAPEALSPDEPERTRVDQRSIADEFGKNLDNEFDVLDDACKKRQQIRELITEAKRLGDAEGAEFYIQDEAKLVRAIIAYDTTEPKSDKFHILLHMLTDRLNKGEELNPYEMEILAELHANTVVNGEWEASRHELIMQQKHGRTGGILGWRTGMHTLRKFMAGDYRATTVTNADGYTHTAGQGTEAASRLIGKNKWLMKTLGGLGLLFGGPAGWTLGAGLIARGAVEAVKRAGFTERRDKETGFSLNEALTEGEIAIAGLVRALSEEVMHAEDPEAKNKAIEALIEAELCASGNNFELHVYRVGNRTEMRASLPGKPPVIPPSSPHAVEVIPQRTVKTSNPDGTESEHKESKITTFDGVLGRVVKTERVFGAVEALASIVAGGIAGHQAVLRGMSSAVDQASAYPAGYYEHLAQGADYAKPGFKAMENASDVKGLARSLLSAKEWLLNIQRDLPGMAEFHRVVENSSATDSWDFIHAAQEAGAGSAHALDSGSAEIAAQTIDNIGAFLNSMKTLVALTGVQMLNRAGIDAPRDALKSEFDQISELYRRVKAQSERIKVPPARPVTISGTSPTSSSSSQRLNESNNGGGGGGAEARPEVYSDKQRREMRDFAAQFEKTVDQMPKPGEKNWFLIIPGTLKDPDFSSQCEIDQVHWKDPIAPRISFKQKMKNDDGTFYMATQDMYLRDFMYRYTQAAIIPEDFDKHNPGARTATKTTETEAPAPATTAPAQETQSQTSSVPEEQPNNTPNTQRRPGESTPEQASSTKERKAGMTREEADIKVKKLNKNFRDENSKTNGVLRTRITLRKESRAGKAAIKTQYTYEGNEYGIFLTPADLAKLTVDSDTEVAVIVDGFRVQKLGDNHFVYANLKLTNGTENDTGYTGPTSTSGEPLPPQIDEEDLDTEGI